MAEGALRGQLAAALVRIEQLQEVVSKSESAGKCLQESSVVLPAFSGYKLQIGSWLEVDPTSHHCCWLSTR